MRLLALTRYSRLGASSRLRIYQYIPYFEDRGWQVEVEPLLGDEYIDYLYNHGRRKYSEIMMAYLKRLKNLLRWKTYDVLWIEKELFPMVPAFFERILNKMHVPYVVEYDDAIFHNYDLHPNRLVRMFMGEKIDIVMKNASLVVAGNEYLANRARKAGAERVEIVPTVIDISRYIPEYKRNDVFTIGWIGSPSAKKYLKLVIPVLLRFSKNANFRLVLVGSGKLDTGGLQIEMRDWTEDTEVKDIQSFDVGIMPLIDDPWERGKCGYKLIQYMACGKPVVASSVGVNKEIVEDGVNGFLTETEEQWFSAFEKLYPNTELSITIGKRNREKVENNYCLQVTAPRLESLFKTLI